MPTIDGGESKKCYEPCIPKDGNRMKQFTRPSQPGGEKLDKRAIVSLREAEVHFVFVFGAESDCENWVFPPSFEDLKVYLFAFFIPRTEYP